MASPRFTFRLQKLLDHRIALEKQEQARLVAAQHKVRQEQRKLDQLLARERDTVERNRQQPGHRVDTDQILRVVWFIERIRKQQDEQRRTITAAENAVIEQERAVAQARRNVKVLEKLKEHQRLAFLEELRRQEQIFLDDIAGQQFIRKAREEERAERRRSAHERHTSNG